MSTKPASLAAEIRRRRATRHQGGKPASRSAYSVSYKFVGTPADAERARQRLVAAIAALHRQGGDR